MWTKAFWKGAGERLIKTGAQVLAASVTVGTVVTAIDWRTALGLTATAMIASLLTSIGNASFVASDQSLPDVALTADDIPAAPAVETPALTEDDIPPADDDEPRHAEPPSVIPDGEGVATN